MNKHFYFIVSLFLINICVTAKAGGIPTNSPSNLMTDLVEHTDRVWIQGYPSTVALHELGKTIEPYNIVRIHSKHPSFSWVVNDTRNDVLQTAYRILLGRDRAKLEKHEDVLWDSGKVDSSNSINVLYSGPELPTNTVLYWKVCTYNNGMQAPWSQIKAFHTAEKLVDYLTPQYPLQKTDQAPVLVEPRNNAFFVDFGKAAFGQLKLKIRSENNYSTCKIRFGEDVKDGKIHKHLDVSSIRFAEYTLPLMKGEHTYFVKFRPDGRNTGRAAILMPPEIGEVYPFRYVEIESHTKPEEISRAMVHYPFDDTASEFVSSDDTLNQVWNLCKYSIKATSFAGIYVDGDRERIPYEADALINQLGHYGVDREFTMARRSHEYLIEHATWPTEWILQSVLMAQYDYLYTGDTRSAEKFYGDLQAKLLLPLADSETGLISTKTGKQTPELMKAIHYNGKEVRDIVDWPHTGILGLGKSEGGETDGFVFKDYNAVISAYHYKALVDMASLAKTLGKDDDATQYTAAAEKVKKSFLEKFTIEGKGYFRDGIGTDHASLHSNMFPLAFGMVPREQREAVSDFIKSRGVACSVYGSQFLMDSIYEAGDTAYGLKLLCSQEERSWYNMIRVGSTISLEAWDNKYKPNQDWNHAWGAVPANTIPRKLVGVEPLEPGFAVVRIKPAFGTLEFAKASVPTIRGTIRIDYRRTDKSCDMDLEIPANMKIVLDIPGQDSQKEFGSGKHRISW